jgi:hypothetical protein
LPAPKSCVRITVRMESAEQAIEDARKAGIDLDLIDTILALTPEERCRHHDAALAVIAEFEKARAIRDARFQSSASAAR